MVLDKFHSLGDSVYGVLAFFAIYRRCLSAEELFCFLIGKRFEFYFEDLVVFLNNDEKVICRDGFYCLNGDESFFEERHRKAQVNGLLWGLVMRHVSRLEFFPFVRMVAIGNTLAFAVADEESDIDLFIVTDRNRLFLTRILVTFYFQILGLRRHGKKVKGRFCLSFYVTDEALSLDHIRLDDDVYLYFWLLTLQPVFGVDVYRRFLDANDWVKLWRKDYVYEQLDHLFPLSRAARFCRRILEFLGNLLFTWWLEPVLSRWQLARSRRKFARLNCGRKSVVISRSMLKFHNLDARDEVFHNWRSRVSRILSR